MQRREDNPRMQDPAIFQSEAIKTHFPEQEQLKCPRCDSSNTKFCYYNNYNLSQPRHFCKNCKRYWTKGGALRNIPVGGGTRKNPKQRSSKNFKPSSSSSSPSPPISSTSSVVTVSAPASDPTRILTDQDQRVLNIGGSFSSLLASNTLFVDQNTSGSNLKMVQMEEFRGNDPLVNSGSGKNHELELQNNGNAENFLSMQSGDSSYWSGSNGWSNLAIYTPGSSFH